MVRRDRPTTSWHKAAQDQIFHRIRTMTIKRIHTALTDRRGVAATHHTPQSRNSSPDHCPASAAAWC
jgi:hypothetical protein